MKIAFFQLYYIQKLLILLILFILLLQKKKYFRLVEKIYKNKKNDFDNKFDYLHYENEIITEKMKKEAGWILTLEHAQLTNGLIRKHKPKNCLEIGVARGGSSILILNAIKDFPDSQLISIDLFTKWRGKEKIGYLVEQKFPELMNKWKLFLGDMPHKFLSKLNLKFDFLFLDTAHVSPGEFFNIIEALPFLNENAIVVLHDTMLHFIYAMKTNQTLNNAKITPTQIYLISSLIGEKILLKTNLRDFENIGVVCLAEGQKDYYLNYFLLMMTIWGYMPTDGQLNGLREFIKKYYKDELLLRIFDNSVDYNKKFFNNLKAKKYK